MSEPPSGLGRVIRANYSCDSLRHAGRQITHVNAGTATRAHFDAYVLSTTSEAV